MSLKSAWPPLVIALICSEGADAQEGRRNPPPPAPWIAKDACPGEGCTLGSWAACTAIIARTEKRATAPIAFRLRRGDPITALSGDVHVNIPGIVTFADTGTFSGLNAVAAQSEPRRIRFTPADTLYLLNYLGEGFLVWWLHGRPDTGQIFWRSRISPGYADPIARAHLIRETRQVWWVKVRNARGQAGWLIPSHATIAGVGGAKYDDGPDRCAGGAP